MLAEPKRIQNLKTVWVHHVLRSANEVLKQNKYQNRETIVSGDDTNEFMV